MRKIIIVVCFLLFQVVQAYGEQYEVVRVIDGDTIVTLYEGNTVKVRLYAVDAPEHRGNQPMWEDAKNRTEALVLGTRVEVRKYGVDMYQRLIGAVYTENGTSLNEDLVRNGLAVYAKEYCKDEVYCAKLEKAEEDAIRDNVGLWALESFVMPSAWRANNK